MERKKNVTKSKENSKFTANHFQRSKLLDKKKTDCKDGSSNSFLAYITCILCFFILMSHCPGGSVGTIKSDVRSLKDQVNNLKSTTQSISSSTWTIHYNTNGLKSDMRSLKREIKALRFELNNCKPNK